MLRRYGPPRVIGLPTSAEFPDSILNCAVLPQMADKCFKLPRGEASMTHLRGPQTGDYWCSAHSDAEKAKSIWSAVMEQDWSS